MVTYLNGNHIKVLHETPKTRPMQKTDHYGNILDTAYFYNANDAKLYLEWLISVVTGAEKVPEDVISEAYDQLFKLILVLRAYVDMDKNIALMKPFDWQEKLSKFEKEIVNSVDDQFKEMNELLEMWDGKFASFETSIYNIENTIEKRTKEMTDALEQLLGWMKKYSPILDGIDKEYRSLVGKRGK